MEGAPGRCTTHAVFPSDNTAKYVPDCYVVNSLNVPPETASHTRCLTVGCGYFLRVSLSRLSTCVTQ